MTFKGFLKTYQKKEVVPFKYYYHEKQPLVSVSVVTYQHVHFLNQCLDGILKQQTNFLFEILLGDDESNDGTRDICLEYAQKYPEKIRLFLHHRENNIKVGGQATGRFNFVYNLFSARGKYIAICEGDDYWTDPLKLQKQVDFLEKNEEYGICFHGVSILEQDKIIPDYVTRKVTEETNAEDLAKGNFIHTPSVVLRNNFNIPEWFTEVAMGDWTLYMIQIQDQKIKKLGDVMAVYRIHKEGLWSNKPKIHRVNNTIQNIRILKNNLPISKISKFLLEKQIQSFISHGGVSICVPTFNGAAYLSETLKSIQSQTYQNIEVIVSDDQSVDETLSIVDKFKNESDFPVRIFHHSQRGIGANWNNSMKRAKGKYIKFLFQDDVMESDCLNKMVEVLEENSEVGLVASKRNFIIEDDVNNNTIKWWVNTYGDLQKEFQKTGDNYYFSKEIFHLKNFISIPRNKIGEPSTVLFRRNLIDEIGYFSEDLKQILDYEYWYRILKKYPVVIINKPLVKFRLHGMQATNINGNKYIDDYRKYEEILYNQYFELLHPDLQKNLYKKYHPIPRVKKIIKRILNL